MQLSANATTWPLPPGLANTDRVRLIRTKQGAHAVTLRTAGTREPLGCTTIALPEGERLSQATLAAAASALRSNCTAVLVCRDLAQAVETYADVIEVQDGVRSAASLPAGDAA